MKLPIESISQRDPRWKDIKLGTSTTSTIGGYGCLLCCHSMMLRYYKHDLLPDALNTLYKNNGVYQDASLINYWKIPAVFSDIACPPDGFVQCPDTPAPLSVIDTYLEKKMPVIALVDFDKTQGGLQSHFVLIIGKDINDYFCNDPWTGETYYFSAVYGQPAQGIYGLRLYQGPVVIEEDNYKVVYKGQILATYERNPIDKINELDQQLKSAKENLAQEIQNNAALQSALTQQEQTEKDLLEIIRRVEKERDDVIIAKKEVIDWSKDLLGIDISSIEAVRGLSRALQSLTASELEAKREIERLKQLFDYEVLLKFGSLFLGKAKGGEEK